MLYCASHCNPTKVGFSVSKKYGKAVRRNRVKAAVSAVAERLVVGYNIVFIPRRNDEYRFDEIEQSFGKLLIRAGLLQ